jgi:hypothetical protein
MSCVMGDLLVTEFNKIWGRGVAGSKSDSKAFDRLLCSRPKAKTTGGGALKIEEREKWQMRRQSYQVQRLRIQVFR